MKLPAPVFFFALLLMTGLTACEEAGPRIDSIYPRIGAMGEVLVIRGEHFGHDPEESFVSIGGIAPTSSAYIEWRDTVISLRTPEFGNSGLVYVHRRGKKSNAALFSNREVIPQIVSGEGGGHEPRISAVEPPSGAIGQAITIRGSNFGAAREGSGVFFAWAAEASPVAPVEAKGPLAVEVSESDLGYELWSEREIRVRVPDGAISGSLEVRTFRGNSGIEFFEVTGKPGTKIYKDKRRYALSYAVNIKVAESSMDNTLYLWVPQPVSAASQRLTEVLSRAPEPFVENHRGTTLYRLKNLNPGEDAGISLSYLVEVYAVETSLRPQLIKTAAPAPVDNVYLLPSPLIPSENSRIQRQAAAITGRESNPYLKAEKIYRWIIAEKTLSPEPKDGGAIEALEAEALDSYMAALLFCALARAAGIPALPVAGVLIDKFPGTVRHYWAEFRIEGFGWVPLDIALAAGAAPPNFSLHPDRKNYYFGNLDNQRIAFSRGQTVLSQMDPRGRVTQRDRDYALQNLWEESVGGLESYSSLWSEIIITGVYMQ
jgi:transglutaminase-like putative cysteine protease